MINKIYILILIFVLHLHVNYSFALNSDIEITRFQRTNPSSTSRGEPALSPYPELQTVFTKTFSKCYEDLPPGQLDVAFTNTADVVAWISNIIQDELIEYEDNDFLDILVARTPERQIVGMAIIAKDTVKEGRSIHIRQMVVLPEFQRQGVGSKIISNIVRMYPGASSINADTRIQNTRAIKFYIKQGFVVTKKPYNSSLSPEKYVGLCYEVAP